MFFPIPSKPLRAAGPADRTPFTLLAFSILENIISVFWLFIIYLFNTGCFVFAKPSWGHFRL
jgi:hypothetical protein